jgi:ferredoxin
VFITSAKRVPAGLNLNSVPIFHPPQRLGAIVTINEGKTPTYWAMLKVHRDICGYCGCCVSVCPEGALELIDAYLCVEKNCTSCGVCAKVCPLGALEVADER